VIEAAPVTSADAWHLYVDLRESQPGQAPYHRPGLLRRLRGHDKARLILVQTNRAIHRLGGGMCEPRLEIGRVQAAGGMFSRSDHITVVAHERSGIGLAVQHLACLLLKDAAVRVAAGARLPGDLELGLASQRRP